MAQMISIAAIRPNPAQPRKSFPDDYIAELAKSIDKRGLIQPIILKPDDKPKHYMIVAGECRWRAHVLLGRKTIKAEVEAITDHEMRLRAIVENLQRRDMNPIDEAYAFQGLIDDNMTVADVVRELGFKGPDIVNNRLNLLRLTRDVQKLVSSGNIGAAMGSAISWAPAEHQARLVREIGRGVLKTVEQVRHAAIALRDAADQVDAFGDMPRASEQDLRSLSRLEDRIQSVAAMVQSGFFEGECIAAQRVSPDRVKMMADKLALIRKHIFQMEHQLRLVATQTELLLTPAE